MQKIVLQMGLHVQIEPAMVFDLSLQEGHPLAWEKHFRGDGGSSRLLGHPANETVLAIGWWLRLWAILPAACIPLGMGIIDLITLRPVRG